MKCRIIFIVWLFCVGYAEAQSIEEARQLFGEKKYAEAVSLFETIVKSTARRNTAYKPEAYRSLGDCFYFLYKFEESAQAYTQCADLLVKGKKIAESDTIQSLIQRSERAARMLSHCENVQIIDSVILNKKDFLQVYFLSIESGYIEANNDQIIYENPLRDKRYFAEKNETGNERLYSEIKLQNNWSDKRMLELPADSVTNDNYPFVLQDGLTIYYASTGNSSIGGYDLFITRYNMNNDNYLNPNQMGMPFNSIANDYMMAIDEINNLGYFATDRFQPEDKVIVYTFLPNEEIVSIETEDKENLISRAKIASIKESWKSGVNYNEYIERARNRILSESMKADRDFSFIINDNIIYYTLNDFESDAAKQAFLKLKELDQSIQALEDELDSLRQTYTQSNNVQKQNLKKDILFKENALFNLINQYEQTKMNVRNLEIKYLRKQ